MKKININKAVKIAVLILAVLALILVVRGCLSDKSVMVGADSHIVADNKYVYFNDKDNDLYRLTIKTKDCELYEKDITVLSARGEELLVKNGDGLVVLDAETKEKLCFFDGINTEDAVLTDKYIYFKDSTTSRLLRLNRETEFVEVVPMMENISVKDFDIYMDKDILFTADTDRIVLYNPDTMQMQTFAEEKKVVDFSANDGYLLYADAYDNYKIYSRDIDEINEIKFDELKAGRLTYKNGKIFYIDNTEKQMDEYKLQIFEGHSH